MIDNLDMAYNRVSSYMDIESAFSKKTTPVPKVDIADADSSKYKGAFIVTGADGKKYPIPIEFVVCYKCAVRGHQKKDCTSSKQATKEEIIEAIKKAKEDLKNSKEEKKSSKKSSTKKVFV